MQPLAHGRMLLLEYPSQGGAGRAPTIHGLRELSESRVGATLAVAL